MGKSEELKTTVDIVRHLLKTEPQTRNSDNFLYLRVLQIVGNKHGIDINNMSVIRFLLELNAIGLPAFETVRRSRQKLQASHPEYAANENVEAQRMLNEKEYRNFARRY